MSLPETIGEIIRTALLPLKISGKSGQKILQPVIADAINNAGYEADKEDGGIFLRAAMPVWRSKNTGAIEITKTRRKIDIVVKSKGQPIALIETESDLNDLKRDGITRRNGHYDVFSIAKSGKCLHFDSYKSLERMAAAACYFHLQQTMANELSPEAAVTLIEAISSDQPSDHNPTNIAMFLVTGSSRQQDKEILRPRLLSLNAQLISASFR